MYNLYEKQYKAHPETATLKCMDNILFSDVAQQFLSIT